MKDDLAGENELKNVLVIGSGLAAYGTCLALLEKEGLAIEVIDVGLKAEYQGQPNSYVPNSKDIKGSFYAYGINDKRWSVDLSSQRLCSSHAFGGFSKVYSGSILRPNIEEFKDWPIGSYPKAKDFQRILSTLSIRQIKDELEIAFPINAEEKRVARKSECLIGKSRIAFTEKKSPINKSFKVPFDVSEVFSYWIQEKKITYKDHCYVTRLEETKKGVRVHFETSRGNSSKEYDRVYLGAGCINTTGIVDRSIFGNGERKYYIKSAPILLQLYIQLLPELGLRDEEEKSIEDYKLCEYFLESKSISTSYLWCHSQIGSLNRIILEKAKEKLPKIFTKIINFMQQFFKFSITVFHSNLGPEIELISYTNNVEGNECSQRLSIYEKRNKYNAKHSASIKLAVLKKFTKLRMIPIPFSHLIGNYFNPNRLGGWHHGGTLPMSRKPKKETNCLPSGELSGIRGVYVVDSSSFPTIPGSTIALLTMANAYRVAKDSTY